jgi:uncharacterized protein
VSTSNIRQRVVIVAIPAVAGVVTAIAVIGWRTTLPDPLVIVIDEVGYLINSAPEFPSLLQRLFTERKGGGLRVVLCGSAFAQMRQLLAPSAPLRGRQHRTVQVDPFDYRTAAAFWGLASNPKAAFRLYAIIGGTPAYRRFTTDGPLPHGDVDSFAVNHLLQPSSALYREGRSVVAEDDALEDKALYWAVLNAVADGASRRGDIAKVLGRADSSLHVPIEALVAAALLEKRPDPLNRRATTFGCYRATAAHRANPARAGARTNRTRPRRRRLGRCSTSACSTGLRATPRMDGGRVVADVRLEFDCRR